jgi:hypothetical protein
MMLLYISTVRIRTLPSCHSFQVRACTFCDMMLLYITAFEEVSRQHPRHGQKAPSPFCHAGPLQCHSSAPAPIVSALPILMYIVARCGGSIWAAQHCRGKAAPLVATTVTVTVTATVGAQPQCLGCPSQ